FSACFGAPFMPRSPVEYGKLLRQMIAERAVDCWLVNTGWTGGPFGVGRRMPIAWTRGLPATALSRRPADARSRRDRRFGFAVPLAAEGVPAEALDPRETWQDKGAFT